MRILLTSFPAYGHVNPMLPLARQARQAGHDVVVATGAELVPQIQRRGFDTWLVSPTHAESEAWLFAAHPNLSTLPRDEHLQRVVSAMIVPSAAERARELVPRALEWKPDIVVHEVFELAGALAAAHTGARHVVHGVGLVPPSPEWETIFGPELASVGRAWQVPELIERIATATYLDICPRSLRCGELPWQQVQPLRPAAGEPAAGERLPEAFAALPHPQTIHLTLGTIFHKMPGVLETAIAGLRELPFNLVVTSGPAADPARLGPQPPHVLVEPYIPHALLLPHCRLVVSHGGAGIMLNTLAHGLPQLILPQAADQFMNAEAGRCAGAGLALTPEELSVDAVRAAAERLLTDPGFEVAAAGIRAEIDTMPCAADVLTTLTTPLAGAGLRQ